MKVERGALIGWGIFAGGVLLAAKAYASQRDSVIPNKGPVTTPVKAKKVQPATAQPAKTPYGSVPDGYKATPPVSVGTKVLIGGAGLLGAGLGVAGGLGAGAAALGAGAAVGAIVVGAAATGAQLTGDVGGAAGAVFNLTQLITPGTGIGIVQSQAGNIGRLVGQQIDRFFGGGLQSNTASNFTLQAGGFLAGMAVGANGLMAVPIVGQLLVFAGLISAAIDEGARLNKGQAGMISDTIGEAQRFFNKAVTDSIAAIATTPIPGIDPAQYPTIAQIGENMPILKANVAALTLGFMAAQNNSRYEGWMTVPHSIFAPSAAQHRAEGAKRAYFVDDMTPVNDAILAMVPGGAAFYNTMPGSQRDSVYHAGTLISNLGNWFNAISQPHTILSGTWKQQVEWFKNRGAFGGSDQILPSGDTFFDGVLYSLTQSLNAGRPVPAS